MIRSVTHLFLHKLASNKTLQEVITYRLFCCIVATLCCGQWTLPEILQPRYSISYNEYSPIFARTCVKLSVFLGKTQKTPLLPHCTDHFNSMSRECFFHLVTFWRPIIQKSAPRAAHSEILAQYITFLPHAVVKKKEVVPQVGRPC